MEPCMMNLSVINIKKTKAKFFEKKAAPKKIKKLLIVRIHDIINSIPDFAARTEKPLKCPKCLRIRAIVE